MKKRVVKNEYIDMNENLEAEDIINQYIKDELSEGDLDFISGGKQEKEEAKKIEEIDVIKSTPHVIP